MENIISIATSAADYETGFVVRRLAELVAGKAPDKRILMICRDSVTDPERTVYEKMYLLDNIPIIKDTDYPGLFSIHAGSALNTKSLHPDTATYIVRRFAEKYDLVICDAGSQIEDALALGCMFESKETYYVLDRTFDSIKKYAYLKPLLDRLDIRIGGHILDHSDGSEYGYSEYTRALGLKSMDDTYMIDADKELDELGLLAASIVHDRFELEKASDYEERDDR